MTQYLVVDDSATVRMTLRQALKSAGVATDEVREATDSSQAITEFRTAPPRIVFLDMMLDDDTGGLDVMKVMLKERPETKVVLVTGLPESDAQVVKAISMGAFAHVQKPVRAESIRRVLSEISTEEGRTGRIR